MQQKDRKQMYRQQTMGYFINAALEIIEEEGIDSLSIRKTAEKAGYNSATLYHYFSTPSHIQTFSGCYSLSMQIRTGIFPTIFTLIMIFFLKVGVKMLQITKICFHLLISQNVNFYH